MELDFIHLRNQIDYHRMIEKEDFQLKIGNFIQEKRKSKGLSGAEFARRLFMEPSNLHKLENGQYSPTLFLICKICEVLEIKLEEFLKEFRY